MPKICPHCQRSFEPRRYPSGRMENHAAFVRRKYCSHACAAAATTAARCRDGAKARLYHKRIAAQQAARAALGRAE